MMNKRYNLKSLSRLGLAALLLPLAATQAADQSIAEFDSKENAKLDWRVVNDGVMGGLSRGAVSVSDAGILQFRGNLSLKNNGGFSSIRTGETALNLSGSDGILLRVRGDGRDYQLRLGSDARYRSMEVSFMAEFGTSEGEWSELRVPFSDLVGSFRGRILKDKVFDPAKIRRLGLLIADKKSGPFNLEVDWIRTYSDTSESESTAAANLLDQLSLDGRFKTLATAIETASLLGPLQGQDQLTVFAPTDQAFARLPKGTLESLLKPENVSKLQSILKYHVSPGVKTLAGALTTGALDSLQGESLKVSFVDGKVVVGNASLVEADIECSNGVIHVIDRVLLPAEAGKNGLGDKSLSSGKCESVEERCTPLASIQAAIEKGVPVFNGGNPAGCASIYQDCVRSLAADERVDKEIREFLVSASDRAGQSRSDLARAWMFRQILAYVGRRLTR